MTWANQVRLLTLNIQQLAATLGQGLIAAVLPAVQALNTLFAVLQKVANAVRDFFYVLTGYKPQSSGGGLSKEVDNLDNSSASLQSVGDSGKSAAKGLDKAAKSAKKLNNNLLGIDELNIISPDTDSSGGSGGSGGAGGSGDIGGGGLGDMESIFDQLGKSDVEGPVNEWAERLRNAFLNQDWDKLGEEIAWGINKGLQFVYDAIKWENVGPKITKFVNAFTQTFNSLVDNIDWELLGRTIGAGANTIVNTLNLLIEGIDFVNLGTKISEGIRGAISEIQWTNLGNLLGNYFMISWNILSGVITGLAQTGMAGLTGFEELGAALGSAFNGIFEKIDFGQIGITIATGLNGVFSAIKAFAITVDWSGLAENISSGLNNMIHGIDWAGNGAALNRLAKDMLGTIKDVAKEVDWKGLGKGIGDFIGNIDWVGIFADVASVIFTAASGMLSGLFDSDGGTIFKLITTFFVASKLTGIGLSFANAIAQALTGKSLENIIIKKFVEWFSKTVIGKMFAGISISSIVSSVGTWITGTFAPAIASALSAVAGVVFTPIGLTVVGAIVGGFLIWKNWDKITEFAGNVKEAVINAFNTAKDWLKEKGKDLVQGLKDGYEAVKNSDFLDKVSKLKDETFEKIGDIKTRVTEKGKNVIQGMKNGYETIKDSQFLNTVSKIKDETFTKIGDIKTKVTEKGKNIIHGLKDGYTSIKESGFLNTVSQIKDETFTKIGDIKTKVTEKGKNIIEGLKDGLDDKWPGFSTTLSKLPEKIKNAIGSLKDVGKSVIQSFIDGLKSISIPLPEVDIGTTTKNILGKDIKVPSINIKWHAKGGLFDGPSVIGVGEAGKEAVIPLENKKTMKTIAKSILDNAPDMGMGISSNEIVDAVASGVLKGMSNALSNLSFKNYSFGLSESRLFGMYKSYVPSFANYSSYSGKAFLNQQSNTQNTQILYLLNQILETEKQILDKDLSVNLDSKRTDRLLERSRNNSGYSFTK